MAGDSGHKYGVREGYKGGGLKPLGFDADSQRRARNYALYERLKKNREYKDVYFDPISGGMKATNIHHRKSSADDEPVLDGKTGKQLEVYCQNELVRLGYSAILMSDGLKVNGKFPPSIDLSVSSVLMDIHSVAIGTAKNVRNGLSDKAKQLRSFNAKYGKKESTVCLYFHEPSMFSHQIVKTGLDMYKNSRDRGVVKTVVCVVKGHDRVYVYK